MTLSKEELHGLANETFNKACVAYGGYLKAHKSLDFLEMKRLSRLHRELFMEHSEIFKLIREKLK